MARDLLLGAFVVADTPVHRLDARVKLVLLLVLTVALFLSGAPAALAAAAMALAALAHVGRIPARSLIAGVRPCIVILAFALVANAFVLDGTGDVSLVGTLGVSVPGLVRGLTAVVRIVLLVGYALVLTATTTPPQVADALVSLMAPLRRLGVPVGDIAMMLSVALRFVPLCAEELVRIRDAQRARGVDFSSGGIVVRLRRWLSVLVPLVVALFRRADDLAAAMQERCYRGEGRTRLTGRLRRVDVAALLGGVALCSLLALA